MSVGALLIGLTTLGKPDPIRGLIQICDVGPVDQSQVLGPLARQLLVRSLEGADEGGKGRGPPS
jgi:hypothetical protein